MTKFHPLALEANHVLEKEAPVLYSLLSDLGKRLFFPKGIVTQSNEAKIYAKTYDATIGIATENKKPMHVPCVRECFHPDLEPKDLFPYAPSRGVQELREFWKTKMQKDNPTLGKKPTSLPVVTSAISHGLTIIGDLFFDPEDTVIVPDQFWGNYRFIWSMKLGVNLVEFPMFNKELTAFNLLEFENTLKKYVGKKQVIVFNFPNNPTGYSLTPQEAKDVRDLLINYAEKGSRFVVVCDDAYFGMVWEESVLYESLFGFLADAHKNILAFKVDGATKEGFMWGFRTGFLTAAMKGLSADAYEALEKKVAGSIRATISSCSLPSQSVVLKAFRDPRFESQLANKKKILHERYREIKKHIYDSRYSDVWDVYPCQSGYFVCLRLKGVEAETLRKHLLMDYGVCAVSTETYDLRIAFSSLEKEHIADMISITAKAVRDLQKS